MVSSFAMTGPPKPSIPDLLNSLQGLFQIYPIELPDCPVFLAVALPTAEGVTGLLPRLPAGRGLTRAQALVSASAEAVELIRSLAQNIDPATCRLAPRDGIAHVACEDLSTGGTTWVPAQRVFLDFAQVYGEPLIVGADSNGCAAGETRAGAVERALLECVERDAVALWWYGRQSRPHHSLGILDRVAPRLSWWLGERSRRTMLIDVTSDLGIPVVVAASCERDGTNVALGSAAAPRVADAALAAATEMIQTETSMAMTPPEASPELAEWLAGASTLTMRQFRRGGDADTDAGRGAPRPLEAVTGAGYPVRFVDLTCAGDHFSSVRIIVPGLCALRRNFNEDRIVRNCRDNPQFAGVNAAEEMETLEPY